MFFLIICIYIYNHSSWCVCLATYKEATLYVSECFSTCSIRIHMVKVLERKVDASESA